MNHFYLKAADGGSGQDPLWIDDIYIENTAAMNLATPVPEPAAGWLIATEALVLLRRRRAAC
jgi:hypothetical protein